MVFELTVAAYESRYAKVCAWAGANGIDFEEGYTTGSYKKAIILKLTKKEMERLFNYLDIEDAPKVRLP